RGRSVAILRVNRTGVGLLEDLNIVFLGTALAIKADAAERMSILQRGGQPDLVSLDCRRRPAAAVDCDFPGDVRFFAPGERQIGGERMPLSVGPAKLRPVAST